MSRPKQFDREDVLARAMKVFWVRGYRGTTLSDLVEAMDINRVSLYREFGSKHGLYLSALDRYREVWLQPLLARLESGSGGLDTLRATLDQLMDAVEAAGWCECMFARAAVEHAGADPETTIRLAAWNRCVAAALTGVLSRAQGRAEVSADLDAEQLTELVMLFAAGLGVLARTARNRPALDRAVDGLLLTLQASAPIEHTARRLRVVSSN